MAYNINLKPQFNRAFFTPSEEMAIMAYMFYHNGSI